MSNDLGSGTLPHAAQRLVHKISPLAVLVRGLRPVEDGVLYLVDVDFHPDRVALFSATGEVDVVVIAETVRQAALMVSHSRFGVAADEAFVMSSMTVDSCGSLSSASAAWYGATVRLHCRNRIVRASCLDTMTVDLTVTAGPVKASGTGMLRVLPAGTYRKLRKDRRAYERVDSGPRYEPARVGRHDFEDVLIGPAREGGVRLVVDTSHEVFFDHPVDHVPGMVVIEACRQMFVAHHGFQPQAFEARFTRYLELEPTPTIEAVTVSGGLSVRVRQDAAIAAEVDFPA